MSFSSELTPTNFQISMDEINQATQNLSRKNVIEVRSNYQIYRGQLSESWGNRTVVIKRRKLKSNETKGELSEALKIATSFHHKYIITFIGYCFEGDELFEVQEYAINKSLGSYLKKLTWSQRLTICISAARGLKYLHDSRVIHGNFSSLAILLDENLEPKITKFSRSVLVSENQNQPHIQIYKSTFLSYWHDRYHVQYEDPIFRESGILRLESDVYSYGLLLFEILSGNSHDETWFIEGYGDTHDLIFFVRQLYENGEVDKLIDRSLNDQIDNHSLQKFLEIAYKCISFNIKDRPTMDEIIKTLVEVLEINQSSKSSGRHGTSGESGFSESFEVAKQDCRFGSTRDFENSVSSSSMETMLQLTGEGEHDILVGVTGITTSVQ
ncbi:putative receptor-like protein kinase At5g39000 [Rutidosis leptorrhynchoides]|uniref:putative receptor-like protein kinase At5g39000 n=1 Tax=Rutidosis leptorrhynchoides TaxID=125765 RepID=UPI003A991491